MIRGKGSSLISAVCANRVQRSPRLRLHDFEIVRVDPPGRGTGNRSVVAPWYSMIRMGPAQKVEQAEFENLFRTCEESFESTEAWLLTERPGLTSLWTAIASSYSNRLNSASAASPGLRLSRDPPEPSRRRYICSSCHSSLSCRRFHRRRHRRCYYSHPWQQNRCSR